MRKADNFNAKQWLTENKITTQSRLNENKIPGVDVDVDGDMVTFSGDSGDYDGFIEADGTIRIELFFPDMEEDEEEINDYNWKDILGPDHLFVKIADSIPTKVDTEGDAVAITFKASDVIE